MDAWNFDYTRSTVASCSLFHILEDSGRTHDRHQRQEVYCGCHHGWGLSYFFSCVMFSGKGSVLLGLDSDRKLVAPANVEVQACNDEASEVPNIFMCFTKKARAFLSYFFSMLMVHSATHQRAVNLLLPEAEVPARLTSEFAERYAQRCTAVAKSLRVMEGIRAKKLTMEGILWFRGKVSTECKAVTQPIWRTACNVSRDKRRSLQKERNTNPRL